MHHGIGAGVPGQHVLKDQFLLADETIGVDLILTGGRDLRLRAGEFDGSESALLDFVAVVFHETLRGGRVCSFHVQVFVQADQIGVKPDDAGDGADDLLLEE